MLIRWKYFRLIPIMLILPHKTYIPTAHNISFTRSWVTGLPSLPTHPSCLPLHRPRQDAPHEVALQGEENDQRQRHGDEGRRGQQVPILAQGVHQARESERERRNPFGSPQVDQRHQQVVPDPQKLEDGQRSQGRDGEGQCQAEESGEVGSTIQKCRFEEVFGQAAEEVAQKIHGERQAIPGVSQPDADESARQSQSVVDPQNGNEGHLEGDH
jgi:hypothetical protein